VEKRPRVTVQLTIKAWNLQLLQGNDPTIACVPLKSQFIRVIEQDEEIDV